jgi:methionine-gamma-lyase
VLSPHDAYLILRGLKTLALRLERPATAQAIAKCSPATRPWARPFPGLPDFPSSIGAAGMKRRRMIAFELKGGFATGKRFMDAPSR